MNIPQLPQLPTDNLYKFMAIAGLSLNLIGLFCPIAFNYHVYINRQDITTKLNVAQAETEMFVDDFLLGISSRPITSDDVQKFRERSKDLIANRLEIENLNKNVNQQTELGILISFLAFAPLIGGFLLMFRGFTLWHYKLQVPLDKTIKDQATR